MKSTTSGFIEHRAGGASSFVSDKGDGGGGVAVYQATVLASGLDLYRKTGMRPNRLYTPKNMMATAASITGQKFRARDYEGAAKALRAWAQAQVQNGTVEVTHVA